jgi:Mn-containing catalase
MAGSASRDDLVHEALTNPQFLVLSGGGPTVTDSVGTPWSGSFVNSNGDLTVDLRSNIGAESRAKIVYEYLLQFTEDPLVHESLQFLMAREIAHFQMFSAALHNISPNFPPGVLQGDPRYTHTYFNLSNGEEVRGPWNQGQGTWPDGGEFNYIQDPVQHVRETRGLLDEKVTGSPKTLADARAVEEELSQMRMSEVKMTTPAAENQWSEYPEATGSGAKRRDRK